MKNIKPLWVLVLLCTFTTFSHAQTIGVRLGINQSRVSNYLTETNFTDFLDQDGVNYNLKKMTNVHFGPTIEFKLFDKFSLETGTILSVKGFNQELTASLPNLELQTKAAIYFVYLDVPVEFKNVWEIGSNSIYAKAGPSLGIGLTGLFDIEENRDGIIMDDTDWIYFDEDVNNRVDGSVLVGAGILLGRNLEFGVTYNHGVTSVINSPDGTKMKHRVLQFSMNFKFRKKEEENI